MKIVVSADNKQHYDILRTLTGPLKDILLHLKNLYEFRMPASLNLSPLIKVKARCPLFPFARAGYSSAGYFIEMNLRVPNVQELYLKTLGHEVAHLAEGLTTQCWSHGPLFDEMDEIAASFIERRKGRWRRK